MVVLGKLRRISESLSSLTEGLAVDSMLKSRDITLPKKVCIVKAMVFPVVTYRCETWTIKKAEPMEKLMLLNCGVGKDS